MARQLLTLIARAAEAARTGGFHTQALKSEGLLKAGAPKHPAWKGREVCKGRGFFYRSAAGPQRLVVGDVCLAGVPAQLLEAHRPPGVEACAPSLLC